MWRSYLTYYLRAVTYHKIHSPKLFDFARSTVENDKRIAIFDQIETRRRQLKQDIRPLPSFDPGAGSKKVTKQRKVMDVARFSLSSPAECRFLYRIARWQNAQTVLELGSSLGISTAYFANAVRKGKVVSIEGVPAIANIAREQLTHLGLCNAKIKTGLFEECLPGILQEIQRIDLLYIDGHHTYDATLQYVKTCLPYCHEKSVIILDDIHWSHEMENAWKAVREWDDVTASIDVFYQGIIFLDSSLREKIHVALINSDYKPWAAGFFPMIG